MKGILTLLARRYIAGVTRTDAIAAALRLKALGISSAIDNLGENVKSAKVAKESAEEYLALLDDIKGAGVDAAVSLKLTHLGLDLSAGTALGNAEEIIKKAGRLDNFVRFDMEGSAYTQRTIDVFLALREKYPNVGIAIQSALKRSMADSELITERGGSIRLVKGAYKEPPQIAFQDKKEVDSNFELIMKDLLLKGAHPAIATHDEALINEARQFAVENNIPKSSFDFELLLGIKRTLQKELAQEGYRVRVYVPYGKNWLPYTIRRLRERKENVYFVLRNIFD